MTNRERILKTNVYDLLMDLNVSIMNGDRKCIKECLIGEYQYDDRDRCISSSKRCEQCIQTWLNEEI